MSENQRFKIHSVKYNFLMSSILKMSSFIFPMITFPYISRILGPIGNGKVSFATSVIYYFTSFSALGIPTYGIKICAQCRNNPKKLSQTVQELLTLGIVLTISAYILLIILIYSVPRLYIAKDVILVTSLNLILSNIGIEWFYQAIEQYDYITVRNLLFKVISIILMFLFVKTEADYVIYAGIQVFATVGSNVLNLLRIKRYVTIKPFINCKIKQHLKPTMIFFMMTVATTIYTNLDTVMLGFMTDDQQVGFYNAAIKMKNILVALVASLGTVLLPRVSYYIKQKMYNEYKKIISSSFRVVLLIAIPLIAYCTIEAENILLILAGKAYLHASVIMKAIVPTILLIGLSNITGMQVLVPLGKEKLTMISTIFGALIDLILNLILIRRYGALGAALGTLIAEFFVFIIQLYFLRNSKYIKAFDMDCIKIVFAGVASTLVLILTIRLITFENCFITLSITSLIFFGTYCSIIILFKEAIVYEYGFKILKRLRRK